jgi:LuxR family maltose regulon positive regulatory protein
MLPEDIFRVRPVLCIGHVAALLANNQVEGVESRLQDAERWLDQGGGTPEVAATEMVVVDVGEYRRLPGWVALYRAALAMMLGDAATTLIHARKALDVLEEEDDLAQGAAAALVGLATWSGGDLEAAHEAYADCTARMNRVGHIADVLGCSITLADLRVAQGRLGEAMRTYESALQLAAAQGGPVLRGTADMYVGMSAIHRERDELEVARQLLLQSQELGEHLGLPQNPYRWCVAMAGVREAEGDLSAALALLEEAERLYVGDFSPNVRPVPASRARVLVAQGRLADARAWALEQGLSDEDDLSYLREFEHVTLARVLLAQHTAEQVEGSLDRAAALLERLLRAAEQGGRTGNVLEILVLQALAHQLYGDVPAALVSLERALQVAEPEGYVRRFVDEGRPMMVLLEAAAEGGILSSYVGRLLTAFGEPLDRPTAQAGLIDPLSQRELDVLRLLGSDLGGPEIARELVVSLNTVRTHTKNIYAKLGVNNRRAAVSRARELDLLSRSRRHT